MKPGSILHLAYAGVGRYFLDQGIDGVDPLGCGALHVDMAQRRAVMVTSGEWRD
jgi:hypothetical protein